jgi:poly(beta-D-mannuronate) lyase
MSLDSLARILPIASCLKRGFLVLQIAAAGSAFAIIPLANASSARTGDLVFHLPVAHSSEPQRLTGDCGKWPAPIVRLDTQSRYSTDDKSRTEVDASASKTYEAQIAPVRQFSRTVVEFANQFTISGGTDTNAANCAGRALAQWAKGNALTITSTDVSNFNRATFLSAMSSAYIQVSGSKQITPADNAVIRNWLRRLSEDTQKFYQKKRESKTVKPNNIQFWAALGVANASVALNDRAGFDWAMKGYELGVCTITPQGAIPREVDRGGLALHYHTFALQPLVSLAELAERNNYPGYVVCEGKLPIAVAFTLSQIDNPTILRGLAKAKQKSIGTLKSNNDLAWLELYAKRFPNFSWAGRMQGLRPMSNTNIGGDLTQLLR